MWLLVPKVPPAPQLPEETLPSDALPTDTLPADSLPADTMHVDALPANTVLVDTLPADTLPTDTLPTDTLPTDRLPTDKLPTDALPADTLPTDTLHQSLPARCACTLPVHIADTADTKTCPWLANVGPTCVSSLQSTQQSWVRRRTLDRSSTGCATCTSNQKLVCKMHLGRKAGSAATLQPFFYCS